MVKRVRCLIPLMLICMVCMMVLPARAQHAYSFGLGAKFGSPYFGVTAKLFLGNQSALEGITSFGGFGVGFTGLYELHMHIPEAPGLRWYFGGGRACGLAP